jgi:serine/threonine protein kinase
MEKHVLSLLKEEENIVNIHATFQDDKCLYMVMDYLPGGELWTICKQFGLINSSLINYYLASLLSVIKRVHAKGIVHRDIKPENVLLNDKHEICVIDFGTARDMDRPEIKGSGNG